MSSEHPLRTNEVELVEALAISLDALAVGSDLESCLDMYPSLADELRPLLIAAQAAQSLYPASVPVEAMNRSRTQTLGRAAELREGRKSSLGFWGWLQRVPRLVLSSAAMVVVVFAGLLTFNSIAARSLPGDSLYPLKLSYENLWLTLTPGSQARENLETAYTERRVDEVRQLLTLGREEMVTFEGVLTQKDLLSGVAPERWLVGDIFVLRSIHTEVVDGIEIGMLIEVEGHTRADGYVEAYVLRPLAFAFVGLVEETTSDVWTIGGRTVHIKAETQLDPGIGLGDEVMVLAEFDEQANIFARAILLTGQNENVPTPTSSPTMEPPATEEPAETNPMQPTQSPTPTPSPSATPSATSSPTLNETPLPQPTATESSSDDNTPEPTEIETTEPTATDEPDENDNDNQNDNDNDNGNDNDNDNGNDNDDNGNSSGSGSGGGDDD